MAEHSLELSLEALEILNFICFFPSGVNTENYTEYIVMDRCYVRWVHSFFLWEAKARAKLTMDSLCVRDIM